MDLPNTPPPGFSEVSSRTRPGQVVYQEDATGKKYGTLELAWAVHRQSAATTGAVPGNPAVPEIAPGELGNTMHAAPTSAPTTQENALTFDVMQSIVAADSDGEKIFAKDLHVQRVLEGLSSDSSETVSVALQKKKAQQDRERSRSREEQDKRAATAPQDLPQGERASAAGSADVVVPKQPPVDEGLPQQEGSGESKPHLDKAMLDKIDTPPKDAAVNLKAEDIYTNEKPPSAVAVPTTNEIPREAPPQMLQEQAPPVVVVAASPSVPAEENKPVHPPGFEPVPSASRPGEFAYIDKKTGQKYGKSQAWKVYERRRKGDEVADQPPPGWITKTSASRPGHVVFVDPETGKKYGELRSAWQVYNRRLRKQENKENLEQVVNGNGGSNDTLNSAGMNGKANGNNGKPPPGFEAVPSRSRPGYFAYVELETGRRYGNLDLAWQAVYDRRAAEEKLEKEKREEEQAAISIQRRQRERIANRAQTNNAPEETAPVEEDEVQVLARQIAEIQEEADAAAVKLQSAKRKKDAQREAQRRRDARSASPDAKGSEEFLAAAPKSVETRTRTRSRSGNNTPQKVLRKQPTSEEDFLCPKGSSASEGGGRRFLDQPAAPPTIQEELRESPRSSKEKRIQQKPKKKSRPSSQVRSPKVPRAKQEPERTFAEQMWRYDHRPTIHRAGSPSAERPKYNPRPRRAQRSRSGSPPPAAAAPKSRPVASPRKKSRSPPPPAAPPNAPPAREKSTPPPPRRTPRSVSSSKRERSPSPTGKTPEGAAAARRARTPTGQQQAVVQPPSSRPPSYRKPVLSARKHRALVEQADAIILDDITRPPMIFSADRRSPSPTGYNPRAPSPGILMPPPGLALPGSVHDAREVSILEMTVRDLSQQKIRLVTELTAARGELQRMKQDQSETITMQVMESRRLVEQTQAENRSLTEQVRVLQESVGQLRKQNIMLEEELIRTRRSLHDAAQGRRIPESDLALSPSFLAQQHYSPTQPPMVEPQAPVQQPLQAYISNGNPFAPAGPTAPQAQPGLSSTGFAQPTAYPMPSAATGGNYYGAPAPSYGGAPQQFVQASAMVNAADSLHLVERNAELQAKVRKLLRIVEQQKKPEWDNDWWKPDRSELNRDRDRERANRGRSVPPPRSPGRRMLRGAGNVASGAVAPARSRTPDYQRTDAAYMAHVNRNRNNSTSFLLQ
ncbi:unnamed protein product [Amoebophrya sp. A120]|nr:unnamed protein product [Amoebophrya sp. A120]|eukprot:GSA120T00001528001.1